MLAAERLLGREPEEQAFNNPGFDILSTLDDGSTLRIEVEGRIAGSPDVEVKAHEILTGKNAGDAYRLAVVIVDPAGPPGDQLRYVARPFDRTQLGDLDVTAVRFKLKTVWEAGREPF